MSTHIYLMLLHSSRLLWASSCVPAVGHAVTPSAAPLGSHLVLPRLLILRLGSGVSPSFTPHVWQGVSWQHSPKATASSCLSCNTSRSCKATPSSPLTTPKKLLKSLHGAFNHYLKIKCFGKPSTLLIPEPGKLQLSSCQASCFPFKKALSRQTSTLLESSAEHQLCPAFPP